MTRNNAVIKLKSFTLKKTVCLEATDSSSLDLGIEIVGFLPHFLFHVDITLGKLCKRLELNGKSTRVFFCVSLPRIHHWGSRHYMQ